MAHTHGNDVFRFFILVQTFHFSTESVFNWAGGAHNCMLLNSGTEAIA